MHAEESMCFAIARLSVVRCDRSDLTGVRCSAVSADVPVIPSITDSKVGLGNLPLNCRVDHFFFSCVRFLPRLFWGYVAGVRESSAWSSVLISAWPCQPPSKERGCSVERGHREACVTGDRRGPLGRVPGGKNRPPTPLSVSEKGEPGLGAPPSDAACHNAQTTCWREAAAMGADLNHTGLGGGEVGRLGGAQWGDRGPTAVFQGNHNAAHFVL